MKTFSTTIYDLRVRHFIHFLGMALGLFLIVGYTVTYSRLLEDLIEWKQYGALITFSLLIAYGMMLLIPKRIIEKRKSTRVLFYLSTVAFTLHIISTIFNTTRESDVIYTIVGALMALVASVQILTVSKGANKAG